MMDHRFQTRLCRVLLVLNLAFIWGNSLLPAEISQTLSDGTRNILMGLSGPAVYSMLVRKLAHFAEFAALGLLLRWRMQLLGRGAAPAALLGLAAACLDEGIQFFVPGRAPGILDLIIDFSGILAGMLVFYLGKLIKNKIQPTQHGGK